MAMTIGILGRATETKVETIRYYERIGLITPSARSGGNYRTYGEAELGRLSFIRRARQLGFSLDQVRALLELSNDRERDCATVDALARVHLAEVEQKLADLAALQRELAAMIDSCHGGTVGSWRIIETLKPLSSG